MKNIENKVVKLNPIPLKFEKLEDQIISNNKNYANSSDKEMFERTSSHDNQIQKKLPFGNLPPNNY